MTRDYDGPMSQLSIRAATPDDEASLLKLGYSGLLWAMEKYLKRTNARVAGQIRALRREIRREFGWVTSLAGWSLGPVVLASALIARSEATRVFLN